MVAFDQVFRSYLSKRTCAIVHFFSSPRSRRVQVASDRFGPPFHCLKWTVLASKELEPVFERRRNFLGIRSLGAYDTAADSSDEDDELLPALALESFFLLLPASRPPGNCSPIPLRSRVRFNWVGQSAETISLIPNCYY